MDGFVEIHIFIIRSEKFLFNSDLINSKVIMQHYVSG